MKQLLLILSLVSASLFSSSYAAAPNTSPAAVQAFVSSFPGAREIKWEQVGVLSKATFVLDDTYYAAFYNSDGELVAQTQNLASTDLPKALRTGLQKELSGRWITDLFVVSVEGEDTYYVTLENAGTTLMLKSTGAKKWTLYKEIVK